VASAKKKSPAGPTKSPYGHCWPTIKGIGGYAEPRGKSSHKNETCPDEKRLVWSIRSGSRQQRRPGDQRVTEPNSRGRIGVDEHIDANGVIDVYQDGSPADSSAKRKRAA